jgi:hypothetical protein
MRAGAWLLAGVTAAFLVRPAMAQQGHTVHEVEPNYQAQNATPAALHDTIVGDVHEAGDRDFFSLHLPANTEIHLAQVAGELTTVFTLLNPDGVTVVANGATRMRYKVGAAGTYYISLRAEASGGCLQVAQCAYGIELGIYDPPPGPGDPTTIVVHPDWSPQGLAVGADGAIYVSDSHSARLVRVDRAGNIIRVADVEGGGAPAIMRNGDILVGTWNGPNGTYLIERVTPSGSVSTFFASSGSDASSEFRPQGITIGPDGDVWVGNGADGTTWHFGTDGTVKEKLHIPAEFLAFSPTGVLHTTAGELRRWVNGHAEVVFSIDDTHGSRIYGLAFDHDGYLYVATGRVSGNQWINEIVLLDPNYHVVNRPFASSNMDGAPSLAFARDESGAMTRRLLVANTDQAIAWQDPRHNAILEVNSAAVRAAGWQIGAPSAGGGGGGGGGGGQVVVDTSALTAGVVGRTYADTLRASGASAPVTWSVTSGALPPGIALAATGILSGTPSDTGAFAFDVKATSGSSSGNGHFTIVISPVPVTVDQVVQALVGGDSLSQAASDYVDRQGNHNGRLDVGDLRAFLRARGLLGVSPLENRKP